MSTKTNVKVVQSDINSKDGQNKCPKCGATEITPTGKGGLLKCEFCRHEFEAVKDDGFVSEVADIKENIIGSGAVDIDHGFDHVITYKCESCGAEVEIDTSVSTSCKCHWCRNVLSINMQIPNGAVPDAILPFNLSHDKARELIETFVNKRKFFANPRFKEEFTTDAIMGVYFPYMLVDINAHAKFDGMGEHLIRRYSVKEGEHTRTYYDAELFEIKREFYVEITGLTLESKSDRLKKNNSNRTDNVINAILPFDTENCVRFDSNYLSGYTSERRDLNVGNLDNIINLQAKDIARHCINDTLRHYDRGVDWKSEEMQTHGTQVKAAYLPVWLYSYKEGDVLHYVAVNARSSETMGSIPIHMPKLLLVTFIIEIIGFFLMVGVQDDYGVIFLTPGVFFYFAMLSRYRNKDARHFHEKETKVKRSNLKSHDKSVRVRRRLSNSRMHGADNHSVNGANVSNSSFGISDVVDIFDDLT